MSHAAVQGYIGGVIGAGAGFLVGGPIGAVIGGAAGASQSYNADKAERASRQALDSSVATPPTPAPAAKPATLAQAAASTNAKANTGGGGNPTKSRASGTIGAEGPQGLSAAPATANLTLLGGTR